MLPIVVAYDQSQHGIVDQVDVVQFTYHPNDRFVKQTSNLTRLLQSLSNSM